MPTPGGETCGTSLLRRILRKKHVYLKASSDSYASILGLPQNECMAKDILISAGEENRDVKALHYLGVLYDYGQDYGVGVPRMATSASQYYRRAEGIPHAQARLAGMIRQGIGVPANMLESVEWYEKAALGGDRNAAISLALMYDSGHGVKQNSTTATKWWQKAAEPMDEEVKGIQAVTAQVADAMSLAQYSLGVRYAVGKGASQDYTEALRWLNRAAARQTDGPDASDMIRIVMDQRDRQRKAKHRGRPSSPLESLPPFEIGTRVQLRGLAGRRFSGLEVEGDERGIIKRFSATSGLYSVKFEDGRGPYNIKPENLIEIP